MKVFSIFSISIFFASQCIDAQNSSAHSEPLKIEWMKQLNVDGHPVYGHDYEQVTSLLLNNDQGMCTVSNVNGTYIFTFDKLQAALQTHTLSVFTSWWQFDRGELFYKDHCNIVKTNWNSWEKQNEICYQAEPGWPATSPVACLGNGSLYYANYNMFYIFYGAESPFVTKKLDELGDPKFIRKGGNKIYLHGVYKNLGSRLMQYDTLGNQKWSVPVGDVRAMLADGEGNCYIAPVEVESTLIKYNSTGNVVWSKPVTGQFIEGISSRGDSILVCGRLKLGSPENQLCVYSIISAKTGEILQQQSFSINQPATVPEHFSHIVSDGRNIYVGGVYGAQTKTCFLVKLSREGNTTGLIDEKSSRSSYSIFPNPGGSKFTISCAETSTATLKIAVRNSLGQVIQKKEISCNGEKCWQLDLGKQPAGNYTVEIQSGAGKTVKKIVVE